MASCDMFVINVPSGHRHFLIFRPPAEPDANVNSCGGIANARTDFLWCVSVVMHRPAAKSHSFTEASILPVITCGSLS